jgi:5'-3' exonuclease
MFVSNHTTDLEERVSYAVHVTLQIISSAWRDNKASHVIMALDGHSWRKEFYKPYKANRAVRHQAKTVKEQEESKAFMEGYDELITFLTEKTNVTVLHHPKLEADDLIAGWIQTHTNDEHIIVSSDSDYHQLLSENVTQYDGVKQELHTITGIYDKKGKPVIDKKTKLPKAIPDPKFILFEKICRGDSSDNVFSAYPGCRIKGTKNKVGITEAFEDRNSKGFSYNNFMLQRWVDADKVEHKVLDDFHRNEILIDLTKQPEDIRKLIDETVESTTAKNNPMVGAQFLKFCGRYNLEKLSANASTYAEILSAEYRP